MAENLSGKPSGPGILPACPTKKVIEVKEAKHQYKGARFMRVSSQLWIMLLATCLLATCAGCAGEPTGEGPSVPPPIEDPVVPPIDPPPEPVVEVPVEIPQVKLTEALAATCLVRVGDAMPEAELPAIGGDTTPLADAYGEKLTVLFFWNSASIYAMTELEDLTEDVAQPFAEKGVRVIGVNEGDPQDVAAGQVEGVGAKFANFLDLDGAYFATVATETKKVPRTFLLDAEGKILWFDIEYSSTTRRDLLQGIQVALGEL